MIFQKCFLFVLISFVFQNALLHAQNVQVVDPLEARYDLEGIETLGRTISLFGARGGSACAALVLEDTVELEIGDMKMGDELIAGNAVTAYRVLKPEVQNPIEESKERSKGFASQWTVRYTNMPYYDVLAPYPGDGEGRALVWLIVEIPRDIPAGLYLGKLKAGSEVLDMELNVLPFKCPAPDRWRHQRGFDFSLEILARTYNLELWSEPHWQKVREALQIMSRSGNDVIHLTPYVDDNYLGSKQPLLRFRKDAEGKMAADISIIKRWLTLHDEIIGEPASVVLDLWDPAFAVNRRQPKATQKSAKILMNGSGGESIVEEISLAPSEESRRMYESIFETVGKLLDELGWDRSILTLGYASDKRPPSATLDFFNEIAPDIPWALFTHGRGDPLPQTGEPFEIGSMKIGHYVHVYVTEAPWQGGEDLPDASELIRGGWNMEHEILTYARLWLYDYVPPMQYLAFPNHVVGARGKALPARGFAHVGFNFWELPEGDGPRSRRGKAPQWANMFRTGVNSLVWHGEENILPTTRFELFRLGQQELEARIAIEDYLLQDQIDPELALECRKALNDLYRVRTREGELFDGKETYIQMSYPQCLFGRDASGEIRRGLFETAGRVQETAEKQADNE